MDAMRRQICLAAPWWIHNGGGGLTRCGVLGHRGADAPFGHAMVEPQRRPGSRWHCGIMELMRSGKPRGSGKSLKLEGAVVRLIGGLGWALTAIAVYD